MDRRARPQGDLVMSVTPPIIPADQRSAARDQLGRFGAGNPGRKPGSKNAVSRNALAAVQSLSSLAILKLRERIEAGDMQAIRLCMEFTLPRGGRTIDLDTANPMAWADAMAEGEISPAEAATAAQALVKLSEVAEIEDLKKRLDEMETALTEHRP
jgi:hypothetical protein